MITHGTHRTTLLAAVVAAGVGLALGAAGAAGLAAQQPMSRPSMQQQQQHPMMAQRMERMMERMDGMRERLHRLDQRLEQQMRRMQDADRLRRHEHLREMCAATDGMLRQMRRNAERAREMLRDPAFEHDPEMLREMERLHRHWDEMTSGMEAGIGIMERMQQRLERGG